MKTLLRIAITAMLLGSGISHAQDYPTRPIRLIVGFPPGGSMDIVARLLGQRLGEQMGQPFIVENRPGAIGTIAINAMASAEPNGYTLLLGTNPQILQGATLESDPYRVLDPIALTHVIPVVLLANPAFAASGLSELIAIARTTNPPLTFATPGQGSPMLLAMEMLKERAGINLLHVPYNGGPPAVNDAAGGHIQLVAVGLPTALGLVRAEKLKPIVVLQESRTNVLPNTPTIREATGITGVDFLIWIGLFAPPKTPAFVVKRIEAEVAKALADPSFQSKFEESAIDVRFGSAADLSKVMQMQMRLSLDVMSKLRDKEK